jgi:hypothetical protein
MFGLRIESNSKNNGQRNLNVENAEGFTQPVEKHEAR